MASHDLLQCCINWLCHRMISMWEIWLGCVNIYLRRFSSAAALVSSARRKTDALVNLPYGSIMKEKSYLYNTAKQNLRWHSVLHRTFSYNEGSVNEKKSLSYKVIKISQYQIDNQSRTLFPTLSIGIKSSLCVCCHFLFCCSDPRSGWRVLLGLGRQRVGLARVGKPLACFLPVLLGLSSVHSEAVQRHGGTRPQSWLGLPDFQLNLREKEKTHWIISLQHSAF